MSMKRICDRTIPGTAKRRESECHADLKALIFDAQSAVAIEDSQIGVQAAKSAGLITIAIPTEWTSAQDFSAADLVLPSLGDQDEPLDQIDECRIGASYLGLAHIATLHATAGNLRKQDHVETH
jgi:hypothetical protein